MWTIFVGIVFGFCIAFLITIALGMREDKRVMDEIEKEINNTDGWCYNHCKAYEKCFADHKDPYDALRALELHCADCPINSALDIIITARLEREAENDECT